MIFSRLCGFFGGNVHSDPVFTISVGFSVHAVELEEGSSACKFFYPLDTPLGYPEKFTSSFLFYAKLPGKRVLAPCRNAPDISFSATS